MKGTLARAGTALCLGVLSVLALRSPAPALAADLEVGQPAPDFQLPDENGVLHNLGEYKGKTLVLAFYPKDFTAG